MEKADLLKYLNDCRDLEVTYQNQCNEQGKLKQRVASMGIHQRIWEPTMRKASSDYDGKKNHILTYITVAVLVIIGLIIMSLFDWNIIAIIIVTIVVVLTMLVMWVSIDDEEWWAYALIFPVWAIVSLVRYFTDIPRAEEEYRIAFQNYQLAVQKDNERVDNENKQIQIIQSRINELEAQKNATSEALGKLYALGIIYPKYQALVPVVMFCEYIEAGRCSQLEGHEGAYNIYESELRQNIIIAKLNDVINRLEQIKDNQWMLYTAIQRGNQKVDQLCSATYESAKRLEGIQNNAAISAENSRITAQNTRILAEIETYRLLTDK